MIYQHTPVLLQECLQGLQLKSDGCYVDATLGGGGHSYHILQALSPAGHLYGFDQDEAAIETSWNRLSTLSPTQFTIVRSNFKYMKGVLHEHGITKVDGILFDLGVSSFQLDHGNRGFSYQHDARLDMRMDQQTNLTAYTIVNTFSESEISRILFEYGEERFSRQIAKRIVKRREEAPIETTFQLVDVIRSAIPAKFRMEGGHPAKRSFQALRIAVNDELGILRNALDDALTLLAPHGRLCVITFHSLEDRIVKELFKERTSPPPWNRNMPLDFEQKELDYLLITRKPIVATEEELEMNNRSHSAKLRIIERK